MSNAHQNQQPATLQCPNCKETVQWSDDFPFRPFCSKRCKDSDFIDWANEEKTIAGNSIYDDVFSDSDLGK